MRRIKAQRERPLPRTGVPRLPGLRRPHVPPRPLPYEGHYLPWSPHTKAPPESPPPAQLLGCRVSNPRACHGVAPQGGLRRRPGLLAPSGVPAPHPHVTSDHVRPGMPTCHSHARPHARPRARAHLVSRAPRLARRAPRQTEPLELGLRTEAAKLKRMRPAASALALCGAAGARAWKSTATPHWFH